MYGARDQRTARREDIFKAYVERGIRSRCKSHPFLPNYIFRPAIFITNSIFDL